MSKSECKAKVDSGLTLTASASHPMNERVRAIRLSRAGNSYVVEYVPWKGKRVASHEYAEFQHAFFWFNGGIYDIRYVEVEVGAS